MRQLLGTLIIGVLLTFGCSDKPKQETVKQDVAQDKIAAKITFLEFGANKCVACKKMKPVMEAVKSNYGDQVDVVFHDVWQNKEIAEQYNIQRIPTQVFLDKDGKEFHRHEGYYVIEDIDKLLSERGLTKKSSS